MIGKLSEETERGKKYRGIPTVLLVKKSLIWIEGSGCSSNVGGREGKQSGGGSNLREGGRLITGGNLEMGSTSS